MSKLSKLLISGLFLLFSLNVLAEPVDINTANASTLAENIKGVGIKKAEAIVLYRKTHGKFKTVAELTKVKGIGQKIVDKNRANLIISKAKVKNN